MTAAELTQLAEYNQWADAKVAALAAGLPDEALHRDMGSSVPTLQGTLFHIMDAINIWIGRIEGRQRPSAGHGEGISLHELTARWDAVDRELVAVLSGADPDVRRGYENSAGTHFVQPVWQMAVHAVNHATHHRGQAITLMRQMGLPPVGTTDMCAFMRQGG